MKNLFYTYIHTYIHTYSIRTTYVRTYVVRMYYVCMYVCIYTHTHTYARTHAHTHVHVHVHILQRCNISNIEMSAKRLHVRQKCIIYCVYKLTIHQVLYYVPNRCITSMIGWLVWQVFYNIYTSVCSLIFMKQLNFWKITNI